MQPLSQTCDACSEAIHATARFCSFCGAPVASKQKSAIKEGGEHRQITVMFCDLIGSTALSNTLDAEDLRDVLRRYQQICAEAIEARDGIIGQYLGDGVLAYWGYPKASESAAMHATDAALDIVREVAASGEALMRRYGVEFATRVALHTGRVLIGDMGAGQTRDRHALMGVVPNLAARLEQIAPRNGVAISARTASHILGAFELESLGHHHLKGFDDAIEAFRVVRRHLTMPVVMERAGPLLGRDRELDVLDRAWQRACRDEASRVAVIAEPGMGKSAVAAAFIAANEIGQDHIIEIGGTLRDRNTPFACLRQTIERWTALGRVRDGRSADAQIASWFGVEEVAASPYAETFVHVLNGAIDDGTEGRRRVLEACLERIRLFKKPILVVLEDAHWIDPSTLEMAEKISDGSEGLMLLRLSRPDEAGDAVAGAEEKLRLNKLNKAGCAALIEHVAGGPVQQGLVTLISDASDGLPLFMEEFTKSLIESGAVKRVRGVMRPADLSATVSTPSSLLDLITVRLDALGAAKALAQICAVLGRSFSRGALAAVSEQSDETLDARIGLLIEAQILTREWSGQLTFRHALFQVAAYESLVKTDRQKWHQKFLDWLDATPNRMQATASETVGFHLEACGRAQEAVAFYLEAGMIADRASASLEAATHFRKCCDLLDEAADSGAVRLQVQVLLANALLSAKGAGAAETRAAYQTAIELADALQESEWHFAAYWGWWRVSETFATMSQRAARLLEKSETMEGIEFKLQSQHCVWANAFQMGEFDTSIQSARDGLALYEDEGFNKGAKYYGGHDCKVCAHGEIALATWLQGAGDAACAEAEAAIDHAESLDHLGSLLHALDIAVMLHHYRRDTEATQRIAARLAGLATTSDLEDYHAKANIFAGWVQIERGDVEAGLAKVDAGFATMQEIGTPEDFPVYQCIRADAFNKLGDAEAALGAVESGHAVIVTEGVNYWGAELARVKATIDIARGSVPMDEISACLDDAARLAQSQGALALELRIALTRLEWVRSRGGDMRASLEALRGVRERFAKGASGYEISIADRHLSISTVE